MVDLLGNDIYPGSTVLYPDGAKFRTGVIKKVGKKTIKIIGIFKDDWRTDIIIAKNKASHLCVQVGFEQFLEHERREYHRIYGETRIIETIRNNETREVTRFFQTCEEYLHERIRMIRQLQFMVLDIEHTEESELKPTEAEELRLKSVIEERTTIINTRRY